MKMGHIESFENFALPKNIPAENTRSYLLYRLKKSINEKHNLYKYLKILLKSDIEIFLETLVDYSLKLKNSERLKFLESGLITLELWKKIMNSINTKGYYEIWRYAYINENNGNNKISKEISNYYYVKLDEFGTGQIYVNLLFSNKKIIRINSFLINPSEYENEEFSLKIWGKKYKKNVMKKIY